VGKAIQVGVPDVPSAQEAGFELPGQKFLVEFLPFDFESTLPDALSETRTGKDF
jgi:hypothetical protein